MAAVALGTLVAGGTAGAQAMVVAAMEVGAPETEVAAAAVDPLPVMKKAPPGGAFCFVRWSSNQTFRFGMICFFRLMIPGRTTVSPATSASKLFLATVLTRSLGTSRVASSFRMSTTKSST